MVVVSALAAGVAVLLAVPASLSRFALSLAIGRLVVMIRTDTSRRCVGEPRRGGVRGAALGCSVPTVSTAGVANSLRRFTGGPWWALAESREQGGGSARDGIGPRRLVPLVASDVGRVGLAVCVRVCGGGLAGP